MLLSIFIRVAFDLHESNQKSNFLQKPIPFSMKHPNLQRDTFLPNQDLVFRYFEMETPAGVQIEYKKV